MRHSHLRAFHNVALHGGFSRAAEALNQTQPALSEQVRRLEQQHDVLLFRRERRQVTLTEAGSDLFRLTRAYFELEEQIAAQLSASRAVISGRLRVVADSAHHITDMLRQFRQDNPSVKVSLTTGNSQDVLSAIRGYEADIGIVGGTGDAHDFESFDLGASPVIAIAGEGLPDLPTGPLSFKDLLKWPLVFREKGSRTRAILESAASAAGIKLQPEMVVEGREAMREVVASNLGIGFVSHAEAGNDTRLVQIPLVGAGLEMRESLVLLRARRDVPVIRAFLKSAELARK